MKFRRLEEAVEHVGETYIRTHDGLTSFNSLGPTYQLFSLFKDEAEHDAATGEEDLLKAKLCCSARLVFSVSCFFVLFNVMYVRVAISMALICMVLPQKEEPERRLDGITQEEFVWSSELKGYLISAAFYGFIVGPFIGGFLSFKFGGKVVLVIGAIAMGVTNLFVPEAARMSPILLFAVRVLAGFFGSFTFPAYYDLVSHWVAPEERQFLVTGTLVAIPMASVLNFPITCLICSYWGWIWLFYAVAIWIILWGIIICFTIFDHPEKCPFISGIEVRYLRNRIPNTEKPKIPWKTIFKSLPIYAYVVMHFCVNYVYLTIIFSLPLLMKDVHHFSLQANGFLSATPFVGSLVMRILLSLFFEQIRQKLKLSKNALRKIFVFVGAGLGSLFFLTITFLSSANRYWVVGCFILATASLELCLTGGYLLSLLDLCPSYVNILTGLTNTVGNSAGLISPIVSGLITTHGTREEWNAVIYVNITVLLLATIFYLVFGQNHLQYWGLATVPSRSLVARGSLVN